MRAFLINGTAVASISPATGVVCCEFMLQRRLSSFRFFFVRYFGENCRFEVDERRYQQETFLRVSRSTNLLFYGKSAVPVQDRRIAR